MEAFTSLSKLSIDEITGTLKSSDDEDEDVAPLSSASSGKLLFTHKEWMKKYRVQDEGCSGSSSDEKKFPKNRRGKGTVGGGGRGESRDPNKAPSSPCFKCHKTGHWARYCPNTKPKKEQAHLAQGEEDEPTLLMAQVSSSVNASGDSSSSGSSRSTLPPPPPHHRVHIRVDKVFAQLGPRSDLEPHRWVLDTRATNHMSGERSVFSELNTRVGETIRFCDESVVEIEGSDTVIFACKNGEHRALTGSTTFPVSRRTSCPSPARRIRVSDRHRARHPEDLRARPQAAGPHQALNIKTLHPRPQDWPTRVSLGQV
jgi:hypothetical protein